MKALGFIVLAALSSWAVPDRAVAQEGSCPAALDYHFRSLGSEKLVHLCQAHRGKLILVVNTASRCGYTYQYEGLEHLYAEFRQRGLVVIGFPSNDFGAQEPGSEAQIERFCRDSYSIQFPIYQKTSVAKGQAHPFFIGLAQQSGEYPRWNFHKYLIDRQGRVLASWNSSIEPESQPIRTLIESSL